MTTQTARSNRVDEYAHLTPLLGELARLTIGEPRHTELRGRVVNGYLPIARHIARRFAHRGEPLDDLEQVATVGLINAVDRFDVGYGTPFVPFAVPTITGEVRRHFRDRSWAMHVPRRFKDLQTRLNTAIAELSQCLGRAPTVSELSTRLDLPRQDVLDGLTAAQAYRGHPLDALDQDDNVGAARYLGVVDGEYAMVEHREELLPALARLPLRERTIIRLRFVDNMTQSQIGARLGISQMHVSRLLTQTLATLRRACGPVSDE